MSGGFAVGDWCWHARQASPCRVIDRQDVWGEVAYRVWLPAKVQGERLFAELLEEHRTWLAEERERARYAFEARYQAIGRIGLPAVREHRRKRLEAEHEARMAALADAEGCTPDLNAVLMLRIGHPGGAQA